MDPIEVTITAVITHRGGPTIDDPDHVKNWLVADRQHYEFVDGGIEFEVCPNCPDPDECDCADEGSIFAFTLDSAA